MVDQRETVLVAGAGGFIGGHLVKNLFQKGFGNVRAVDSKPLEQWYQRFPEAENVVLDLQEKEACETATDGIDIVFNLAAGHGRNGIYRE